MEIQKPKVEVQSLKEIHGISIESLSDAPSIVEVTQEVQRMLDLYLKETGEHIVFIGHSVTNDIQALNLSNARYIDTTNFRFKSDQHGKIRKLKDLVSTYLNA